MKEEKHEKVTTSMVCFEGLEKWTRLQAQGFLQRILDEEVTQFFNREKSARVGKGVDITQGHRNGHGKPRRLSMSNGTIEVRRPRVRMTEEKFESEVLPLFKR